MENMGQRIKDKRKEKKLTQKALADMLNVSDKAVSKWERGESLPDISVVPSIASVLDVSLDWLFYGDEKGTQDKKYNEHQAKILSLKIEREYFIGTALVLLFMVFGVFWHLSIYSEPYENNIITSIIPPFVGYIVFTVAIILVYLILNNKIKADKIIYSDLSAKEYQDNLGKAFVVSVLSSVAVTLIFSKTGIQWDGYTWGKDYFINEILISIAKDISGYSIDTNYVNCGTLIILFIIITVINTIVSRDKFTYRENVVTGSFILALAPVASMLEHLYTKMIIYRDKVRLFTFYLEREKAVDFLQDKAIREGAVFAIVAVISIAFAIKFIADKQQRKVVIMLCVINAVMLYLISAFSIDKTFDGTGRTFAAISQAPFLIPIFIICIVPQIIMILNGLFIKE